MDRKMASADMEPRLVQAADLIGQLGDPMYSRKANALYFEFEEIGMNPATRIFVTGRSHRQISRFLLEQCLDASHRG